VWVYFIERKNKSLYVFRMFKTLAKNHFGKRIGVLNTNRGGNLCNYAFEFFFFETCGMKIQRIGLYNSQQNGVVE
jgi:hypothetical protein